MNVVDILKCSVGAEHLVIGWIEHERGTFALAVRNPKDHEAAVRRLMVAAQNTRRALSGGAIEEPVFVQLFEGHPVVWTTEEYLK